MYILIVTVVMIMKSGYDFTQTPYSNITSFKFAVAINNCFWVFDYPYTLVLYFLIEIFDYFYLPRDKDTIEASIGCLDPYDSKYNPNRKILFADKWLKENKTTEEIKDYYSDYDILRVV